MREYQTYPTPLMLAAGQLIAVNVGGAPAPAPSSRYRGGSSENYGEDGEPISEYGGSNYGEEEEEEEKRAKRAVPATGPTMAVGAETSTQKLFAISNSLDTAK